MNDDEASVEIDEELKATTEEMAALCYFATFVDHVAESQIHGEDSLTENTIQDESWSHYHHDDDADDVFGDFLMHPDIHRRERYRSDSQYASLSSTGSGSGRHSSLTIETSI